MTYSQIYSNPTFHVSFIMDGFYLHAMDEICVINSKLRLSAIFPCIDRKMIKLGYICRLQTEYVNFSLAFLKWASSGLGIKYALKIYSNSPI
jgi:hypothetical protein